MPWSDGLEPQSPAYEIAASENDRVRVVAGPGTGKSFAMKRRVARLLESGINPALILPVTFTRVAAEDLHRELVGMEVPGCDELKGQTLHSLALRILMRNHVLAATGRAPRPLNDFEVEPLVCDLMARHGGKREVKKRRLAFEAAWARLQNQEPGYAPSVEDAEFQTDLVAWLRFHEAMLIGEVIPQVYQYLHDNPAARERGEFAHVLVDEYQDLNKAEQGVIELLSEHADVCIVGDDDQSIYSFKHAHPDGIREWLAHNNQADDLDLNECRRCPTNVVDMANHLIQNNANRPVPRPITPVADNGRGIVQIIQFQNIGREVEGIANLVENALEDGAEPGDILILTQSRAFGKPIFEALVRHEIPSKSYYAESELHHDDAKYSLAILKLWADREDKVALRWLVGFTGSRWNAAGYKRVRDYCESSGVTPYEAFCRLAGGELALPYTGRVTEAFSEIKGDLERLDALEDLAAVVDELFPEDRASTRDLRSLSLSALEEVDDDAAAFASEISRAISQPEIPDIVQEVRVMSLHKSKGLSAPVTIIAGCVEGLLPRPPSEGATIAEQDEHLEEQRRLFYVGVTRVKAEPENGFPGTLIITYSQEMLVADALNAGIRPAQQRYDTAHLNASRFVNELGPTAPRPVAG